MPALPRLDDRDRVSEAPSCQNKSISVMRRLGLLCLVFAVTAAPVWARHGTAGCGTTATTPAEVLFLHRQAERARAARPRPLAAATASTNRDIGNLAIIENRDGVVETLNQFDLDHATLTFTPVSGGPPRIAPLFDDLDPSQPSGSVRFYADASHVVFSWVNVPEWAQYGLGAPQTFQVRLYADGSIQFSYSGVSPTSAVVGIAPGSDQPGTSVVSFLNDASAEYPAAVAETFGSTPEIDIVTVAQKFYETHEDAYDYLVIYNNMEIAAMTGAVAYETTVRSSGIGYSV